MDSTAKKCDCLTRQHRGEEPSKMTRTLRNVAMRWVVFTGALLTVPCSFASSIGKPPLETIPVPDVAPLPEVSRADDSQSRLIAEVVVTAQKREENLQDVPISVQAFSAEDMAERGTNEAITRPHVAPCMVVQAISGCFSNYILV